MADLLAADDGVESGRTADDVVRLDGEHLAESVGGSVSKERPHFHLAEALTADLGLAAERLLGNEGVWTDRAHVDLVLHHVVKLQDVHVSDGGLLGELLAGAAVA